MNDTAQKRVRTREACIVVHTKSRQPCPTLCSGAGLRCVNGEGAARCNASTGREERATVPQTHCLIWCESMVEWNEVTLFETHYTLCVEASFELSVLPIYAPFPTNLLRWSDGLPVEKNDNPRTGHFFFLYIPCI